MPMTETELRDLLAERSARPPVVVDRVSQVRRRVARRRHRRQVVGALASVVVMVAMAAVVVTPHWLHRSSAVSAPDSAEPPLFHMGGKLIASTTLQSPRQGSVSLTFTPSDRQFSVYFRCGPDALDALDAVWVGAAINRHGGYGWMCGPVWSDLFGAVPQRASWGVAPGKPSTLTISLDSLPVDHATPSPLPPSQRPTGVVEVAVYEQVPVDQYVFPPRPAKLLPLSDYQSKSVILDSRKVGANGSWKVPVTLSAPAELAAYIVAPGSLTFAVDGKTVGRCDWWDYTSYDCAVGIDADSLKAAGLSVRDGQTIDVTVTASRFADPAWLVDYADQPPGDSVQP